EVGGLLRELQAVGCNLEQGRCLNGAEEERGLRLAAPQKQRDPRGIALVQETLSLPQGLVVDAELRLQDQSLKDSDIEPSQGGLERPPLERTFSVSEAEDVETGIAGEARAYDDAAGGFAPLRQRSLRVRTRRNVERLDLEPSCQRGKQIGG